MSEIDKYMQQWIDEEIFEFTDKEEAVLSCFFTNTNKRIYFMHSLPANIAAALFAMFSRLKNPRGLRGLFIDAFLPEIIVGTMKDQGESGLTSSQIIQKYGATDWQSFLEKVPGAKSAAQEFINTIGTNPEYLVAVSNVERVSGMLRRWLDAYGHNSIARTAHVYLCCECISILAVKCMEWSRPGVGYIEASTRFLRMDAKGVFPVGQLLGEYGIASSEIGDGIERAFEVYRYHLEHEQGLLYYLRQQYAYLVEDGTLTQKQFAMAVEGEVCDVLGNVLPAATLTSVGVGVSGESLGTILQHLSLDETPENNAIILAIIREAEKTGAVQFIKHWEPTLWKKEGWRYLSTKMFNPKQNIPRLITPIDIKAMETTIATLIGMRDGWESCAGMDSVIESLLKIKRCMHDKLPNEFESVCIMVAGLMTFRTWRDIQRHGLCTHNRTAVIPELGFYQYPKPHPAQLDIDFQRIHQQNRALFLKMQQSEVPVRLCEYLMALGTIIGYTVGANMSQWEFMMWQRTKHGVHDEARRKMLEIDMMFQEEIPWWSLFSRTDRTPQYIFARTPKPIL
ncbi:MAG: hypothetical protein RIQ54_439 [Candidatus Parcubacteria bacterium]